VPSAVVTALTAPIREVQSLVGPGWSGDPFTDPAAVLRRARDALIELAAAAGRSWDRAGVQWAGAGADGAADFMATTVAAIDALAARADQLSIAANTASAAVAGARARLQAIVDRFEARAQSLEPFLDDPAVTKALTAEAQRSLAEAVAVVENLQEELDGHAAALSSAAPAPAATSPASTSPAGPPAPAATSPAGPPSPATGSGFGGASPMRPPSGSGGAAGLGGLLGDLVKASQHDASTGLADPGSFGDGVAVRLPDGGTATAPNAVAASAVRHALTQLGVPYDWGGTTPGVGLDCSGLTQWAYHEAGLNIPRLAQEQDVGAPVDAGALRPGDLAVWDGHVAMIVGNGTMIEAGDPVKLSPIRTTNAGQGFQGFWRPTG
jgi:cell wall-associated NlpC family hydrolase